MSNELSQAIAALEPAIRSSLDPVCILNEQCEIVEMNQAARSFFGIRKTSASRKPVFCNLIKLAACAGGCQIEKVIAKAMPFRLDEAPAARGETKLRVMLQAVPIRAAGDKKGVPIGAMVSLRDTTAEVILQAKYHKVMDILADKDIHIADQEDKIRSLQQTLKRAAIARVAR